MQLRTLTILLILFSFVVFGCQKLLPKAPESQDVLAEPIEGLTAGQMLLHLDGDGEFARVFGTEDGLGPIFVQASCENCHVGDGKGNPANNLTRFGRYENGGWSGVPELGGPQLQHRSILNYSPEELPEGVESSQFIAPNVTGLGYLAAVTDDEILSRADPDDADGDGISGSINLIIPPAGIELDPRYHTMDVFGQRIGRFGRKSAAVNLTMQTVGAYKQDMGITSDFDTEDPVNMAESGFGDDGVADPEIPAETVNKVVFYLQTLKAPTRRNMDDVDVIAGEQIFEEIGCESCHRSTLTTGPSEIEAINEVEFYPYTDMLMHDMGPDLDDNYTEGIAETYEWRTTPLWGLGLQGDSQGSETYYLHDGRTTTIDGAIGYHGGEAAASRSAYDALSDTEKAQLIKFLESL